MGHGVAFRRISGRRVTGVRVDGDLEFFLRCYLPGFVLFLDLRHIDPDNKIVRNLVRV
jgi:hypothetical protein